MSFKLSESVKFPVPTTPAPWESRLAMGIFLVCLVFHFWGVSVGWQSKNLPGNEFREAQTALSAYWIKADNDFSLAYPTPVVGKPWSIPMEFPLYQWTVVATGKVTGWGLTKAGRAVSIACFYLTLPAVFLLLRRWDVAPGHRWLVLAVVVTCPFYVYFARAFLIETMALMFSLWFWVAFERSVAGRSQGWLAVAILAGTGAGLVKVTTFMLYLLPAAWWAIARLWATRRGTWRTDLGWMTAAVAIPFAATLWWLHFADLTKAQNVLGQVFTSTNLRDFNWGTWSSRVGGEWWEMRWRIIRDELTWLPAGLICGVVGLGGGWRRWGAIAACLAIFGAAFLIFPILYALHNYYYVANTLLLLVAMGLALVAGVESGLGRTLAYAVVACVLMAQGWRYLEHYYPGQAAISPGGDGLTRALQATTNPREVIVVLGRDWSSIIPYYTQRRAMMIRSDIGADPARVEQALAALDGEKIGALVLEGHPAGEQWLIDRVAARGIDPRPVFVWRETTVYLSRARRDELVRALLETPFHEVAIAQGVELPKQELAGQWIRMADVYPWLRGAFIAMEPKPVRFFSRFGPNLDGSSGQPMFGAHPVTKLVFSLPAGRHHLRSALQMPLDAYRLDIPATDATDGVEVGLWAIGTKGERTLLAARYFDPRNRREDRGSMRPLEFTFELKEAGEVELFFGPGPKDKDTRDWIQLGPLRID